MGGERLQDLKRDLHGFIAARANIALGGEPVSHGGETFLSEEIAVGILQLTKNAFMRCQALSPSPRDLPNNATEIFSILVSYLVHEHVEYAVDVGLQGISSPDTKTVPELYFFDVLGQANAIMHLFEKQFHDSVLPLVAMTAKHADCLQKKKSELEKLEHKLDTGLDRSLATIAGWVRTILTQEQKKTDFNPEAASSSSGGGAAGNMAAVALTTATTACTRVIRFVNGQVVNVRKSLDGNNVDSILEELGARFHRVVYEHLLGFQYSSAGAMAAICDVQEYRRCATDFKIASVNALFDTLHALCNLLLLPPENLRGAMCGDQLANLDRMIVDNWIQLRTDYKTEKLAQSI